MERPSGKYSRHIRETSVKPKFKFGVPVVPGAVLLVSVTWFYIGAGVFIVPTIVGAMLYLAMLVASWNDPHWFQVGAQKLSSLMRRAWKTRGRSLFLRPYKAAR